MIYKLSDPSEICKKRLSGNRHSCFQFIKSKVSNLIVNFYRFCFCFFIGFVTPLSFGSFSMEAAELIFKKGDGSYLFRCGAGAYQGKVRIIPLRDSRFRIFGYAFVGESYAKSNIHAARKGCGEDKLDKQPEPKNK